MSEVSAGDDNASNSNVVTMTKESGGDRPYTIRALRDGDTYRVGAMLAKVMGHGNLRYAASTGEVNVILAAGIGALFDEVPREVQLFCADLIGITRDYKEYRERDADTQRRQIQAVQLWRDRKREAENRGERFEEAAPVVDNLKPEDMLRAELEDDIIAEFEGMPPGTSQNIIAEIMERDDFVPFINSSRRLFAAAKGLSGRFGTPS